MADFYSVSFRSVSCPRMKISRKPKNFSRFVNSGMGIERLELKALQ